MKAISLLVVSLFASFPVFGAALGQTPRASMLGYAIGGVHVSVDDPQGDTANAWALQPAILIYTARLFSGVRYWSELYYYQAGLNAATNRIGQDVERFGLHVSLQKSLPVSPRWINWLGVGLGISQSNYSSRHIIDNEGFLLQRYPDRRNTGASLLLNFNSEWSLNQDWRLGVKLEQAVAITGDGGGSQALLALLYRY